MYMTYATIIPMLLYLLISLFTKHGGYMRSSIRVSMQVPAVIAIHCSASLCAIRSGSVLPGECGLPSTLKFLTKLPGYSTEHTIFLPSVPRPPPAAGLCEP